MNRYYSSNLSSKSRSMLFAVVLIFGMLFTLVNPGSVVTASNYSAPNLAITGNDADVTLGVPTEVSLGDQFDFTVTFDNTSPDSTGYGPYIDLYIPLSGADGNVGGLNDGLSYVQASYITANLAPISVQSCLEGAVVTHPLTNLSVTCPTESTLFNPFTWQLVVLQLPFGSFTPTQTPAVVTVTVDMQDTADEDKPLPIIAKAGYMYGNTATGQNGPLVNTTGDSATVDPYILRVSKTYSGPESETATGPNYLREYTVTADIANGQTITSFIMSDFIPANMQFTRVVSSGGATCTTIPVTINHPWRNDKL